jgi:hypothetical protein
VGARGRGAPGDGQASTGRERPAEGARRGRPRPVAGGRDRPRRPAEDRADADDPADAAVPLRDSAGHRHQDPAHPDAAAPPRPAAVAAVRPGAEGAGGRGDGADPRERHLRGRARRTPDTFRRLPYGRPEGRRERAGPGGLRLLPHRLGRGGPGRRALRRTARTVAVRAGHALDLSGPERRRRHRPGCLPCRERELQRGLAGDDRRPDAASGAARRLAAGVGRPRGHDRDRAADLRARPGLPCGPVLRARAASAAPHRRALAGPADAAAVPRTCRAGRGTGPWPGDRDRGRGHGDPGRGRGGLLGRRSHGRGRRGGRGGGVRVGAAAGACLAAVSVDGRRDAVRGGRRHGGGRPRARSARRAGHRDSARPRVPGRPRPPGRGAQRVPRPARPGRRRTGPNAIVARRAGGTAARCSRTRSSRRRRTARRSPGTP